jgi:para-nitrobenzyl esterase
MPNALNPSGNFEAKAAHTIDIQFLFDNWHGGQLGANLDQTSGNPRELAGPELPLSAELVAAWTNFAANGDPNVGGGLGVTWPALSAATPVLLNENTPGSTQETVAAFRAFYQCAFWDNWILYPPN